MRHTDGVTPQTSLHGSVLDRLGVALVTGELAPGDIVRGELLEERYGASRSVVREAVRVLESMGLVESRRRLGIVVLDRSSWNVFDPAIIRWRLAGSERDRITQLRAISELRTGIEPAAAALAARRATPEQCATLAQAVRGLHVEAERGDLEAYLAADVTFHETLLAASGNDMFASLGAVVTEVLAGRTHHHLMPTRPNPDAIRLHGEVASAVQVGDAARAQAAMQQIIDEADAALAAQLS